MEIKTINDKFSVSGQITPEDIATLKDREVRSIICNRPDQEAEEQPAFESLQKTAEEAGIGMQYLPVVHDTISAADVNEFERRFMHAQTPVHAFCRSGLRSITLWGLMQVRQGTPVSVVVEIARQAGFDFSNFASKFAGVIAELSEQNSSGREKTADVVIVGGGAAGISVASSLLRRQPSLDIVIIDPADSHYYQPGFTLVGRGVFNLDETRRRMAAVMPEKVNWIKKAVTTFLPEENTVVLENGNRVSYRSLVVCPGLKLNWAGVEGLEETLGKNGVTSNYSPQTAPYTWELVQTLKSGKAIFTQPPMPIKCAGAPQKALYLSADYWRQNGLGKSAIDIEFCNAGAVLFGVKEYVPALQAYMDKYEVTLSFGHNLVRVDGPAHKAWFSVADQNGETQLVEKDFAMLHVCPPQQAPDFIRQSPLVDEAGWVDVDQRTLQHKRYADIWALGDAANTPNAKTAAAVRVQAPIVAANLLHSMHDEEKRHEYNGYGSCPLTVEKGKIVLAEFGYGGKLLPTFPGFVNDGTRATRLAWVLKKDILPQVYWKVMLKGREWLVSPD